MSTNTIAIPSGADFQKERDDVFGAVLANGLVDDILLLIREALICSKGATTRINLPREISRTEFGALSIKLAESGWGISYNLLGFITGHKLIISELTSYI